MTPPLGKEISKFEVTWLPGTKVISADVLAKKLKNPEAPDRVFLFDPAISADVTLEVGQVLVLTGVDLVRVKAIGERDGLVAVETEPASLVDAVSDADVEWGHTLDYAATDITSHEIKPLSLPGQPGEGASKSVSFKGKIQGMDVKYEIAPSPTDVKLTLDVSHKREGTNSVVKVSTVGVLKPFYLGGNINIRHGKLESFVMKLEQIDLKVDVSYGAVETEFEKKIELPVEIKVPYAIGPVPTYITLGGKLELSSTLQNSSSSLGKATFTATGSLGLKYDGSLHGMGGLTTSTGVMKDSEAMGTVTTGLGVLAEFPRLGFGGGIPVAGADAYFAQRFEALANLEVEYGTAGNFPVIIGNCFKTTASAGGYVGGTVRLAGFKIPKEVNVYAKTMHDQKSGKSCK